MISANTTRIDKFLWAVRLFKTRALATEACKKGKVKVAGMVVKPSREIKTSDVIILVEPNIKRQFEVLAIAEKRMGAGLVAGYLKDITPAEELEALELSKLAARLDRSKGLGRPTKKERRDLDGFFESGL